MEGTAEEGGSGQRARGEVASASDHATEPGDAAAPDLRADAIRVLRGETPTSTSASTVVAVRQSTVRQFTVAMWIGGVALVGSVLLAVSIGAVHVPIGQVVRIVGHHLFGSTVDPTPSAIQDRIIWGLRLPRVLLAALVGGALSVAGAVLQAVVRNPLADPYVLGVAEGASLAAVAVIVLGPKVLGGLGVSGAAFLGALVALGLALVLGQRRGAISPLRLLLAGVALSSTLSAATSYLQLRAEPGELASVVFWLLGSVVGATWSDLGLPALALVLAVAWLVLRGRSMNALLMGDEAAASLGVPVARFRLELLVIASLLTGVSVAVAGAIGFVGLVIPHGCRLLVGADHRRVLPLAVVVGSTFLVVVDLVARTVQAPSELPLGIFTAAIGGPAFIWLLRRSDGVGVAR